MITNIQYLGNLRQWGRFFILFFFVGCAQSSPLEAPKKAVSPLVVTYFQKGIRYQYRIDLLKMALEKALGSPHAFILKPLKGDITQARGMSLLQYGFDSVAYLPTSKEREAHFLAVKIPLMYGMLGFRVFLIHASEQASFAQIDTLQALKNTKTAGFGSQWADMGVLTSNYFKVMGVANYDSLFEMLNAGRFDYFPRGINEAWKERQERYKAFPNLVVEKNLALYYPLPIYFFVNKDNTYLASLIEKGLKAAEKDGSLRKLFLKYHLDIIHQAKLKTRHIFRIVNPNLPKDVPKIDTLWWQNL
jgi:hypothetical protein